MRGRRRGGPRQGTCNVGYLHGRTLKRNSVDASTRTDIPWCLQTFRENMMPHEGTILRVEQEAKACCPFK